MTKRIPVVTMPPVFFCTSEAVMEDKDKKYKYTKQLLKLAIEESGYTNADIAKKSRLSDKSVSLVSRWRNGKAQATEVQMHYFIKEYGHLLKKKLEHLFYTQVLNVEKSTLEMAYQKLEGEILFKSQIKSTLLDSSKNPLRVLRLIILEHKGCYDIIVQYRAGIINYNRARIDSEGVFEKSSLSISKDELYCSDNEESNWFFDKVIKCENTDTLILNFKMLMNDMLNNKGLFIFKAHRNELFTSKCIDPVEFAFYHKLMKSGLQSDHLPF